MPPRKRERASGAGLLPLMEARPWKDGKTITYRYHPIGGKPIKLGTDRAEAIRSVANMLGKGDDEGTIGKLWEHNAHFRAGVLVVQERGDSQGRTSLVARFVEDDVSYVDIFPALECAALVSIVAERMLMQGFERVLDGDGLNELRCFQAWVLVSPGRR